LFGLAAFAAQKRTKELGIRKVLGATVADIVALLAIDFVRMIAIGIAVAIPVAVITARWWLDDFAYRIELGATIFLVAAVVVLAFSLLTIGYHALRAAVKNPVESLRYE
jgi:putative ABC transport system permease protein